jgi:polar amino acid transport system substrate-binding protein
MDTIQHRGHLVAGVDQTTLLFAYRDPTSGQFQGFEIDLLHEIARALLGDPNAIEFRPLTPSERIPAIRDGSVDLVASLFTMTCERWADVDFSSMYFLAHQQVLVPTASTVQGVQDLNGKRVCATLGSTSIDNIRRLAPAAVPFPVITRADCLIALQQGTADAVATDSTILEGFARQDRQTRLLPQALSDEPYGIAIKQQHPEFVRFVNGVLQQIVSAGTWDALAERWLGDVSANQRPPSAHYRD